MTPPTVDDWEKSAVDFLLQVCPTVLHDARLPRRQPVVLAYLAEGFVEAQLATCGDLLSRGRVALGAQVEPEVVAGAVEALGWLQAYLLRTRREVGLVAGALRGEVYRPRL